MNLNHKTVTEGNEVVEAKKPSRFKAAVAKAKAEITPKKVAKAIGKAAVVVGAGVGGFVLGRVTCKSSDDAEDQAYDNYEFVDEENSVD